MAADATLAERFADLCRPLAPMATGRPVKLAPLDGIRVVAFDVYGTMFISGSGDVGSATATHQADALFDAVRAVGGPALDDPPAAIAKLDHTIRHEHAQRTAEDIDHPEIDIRHTWSTVLGWPDRAMIEALAVEYECRVNPTWPMPGLLDTLAALRRRGLRLAIVSNAQFYTPIMFLALLGRSHEQLGFDEARCVWSYRLRQAKPSGLLYRRLMDRLCVAQAVKPHEVLYLGNDMRNDIAPAARLGMRTCLFAGDRRSLRLREDDPLAAGVEPDACIDRLEQLAEIIHLDGGASGSSFSDNKNT